jgi:hypothetical protein
MTYPILSCSVLDRLYLCRSIDLNLSLIPERLPPSLYPASGRHCVCEGEGEDESVAAPSQRLPRRCAICGRHRIGRSPHVFAGG